MGIQEVGHKGKENVREYANRSKQKRAEGFQESLLQNLKSQEYENTVLESEKFGRETIGAGTMKISGGETVTEARADKNTDRANVGLSGTAARIRASELMKQEAVQTAEVRRMSYEESDHIEIAVAEGYTLKGKLEGSRVYVEAKYDDGRLEAYQVDPDKVQEQTQHRIEQFALETADRGQ